MRNPTSIERLAAPADTLALAVLAIVALIAAMTFKNYGLGWDDYAHSHYGELLYSFYATGFADRRAFEFSNLFYYGGGFDLAASILDRVIAPDLFESRRLMGAIVGMLGLVVVWRTARRLGGPIAGLMTLALLAVTPAYYGHMFINAKDIPFAVAMAFLLYATVRAFDEYPRPRPVTVIIFGIATGLLIGTRLIGGIAVLFIAAALLVALIGETRTLGFRGALRRAAMFVLWLALSLPLAYAVMALVWPWAVLDPLNPLRALHYFSNFWEKPWKELYDGVKILIPSMPRSYLPKLYFFKLPEIFGLLAIGGLAGVLIAIVRGSSTPNRRAALALIAAAVIIPMLLVVIGRPVLYNGIRHFLFVLPPLAIVAGLAGAWLIERLLVWRPAAALAASLVVVAAIGLTVSGMVRIHPYQYALFNQYAGGVRGASDRFMLDYWGLGFKEASETLLEKIQAMRLAKPANRKWQVAVCGPVGVVKVELGDEFSATNEAKGADFALSLGTFYCAELYAPILHEVRRDGVVFARVYDLRRHPYSTTYAPPTADEPRPDGVARTQEPPSTFWQ